jgi:sugar phosphate permease
MAFLSTRFGWRAAFYIFGAAGILLAIVWYLYYRDSPNEHSGVNTAELELLGSVRYARPKIAGSVPWRRILHSPDLLYLSLAYFCYGWVFWIYLQWLPTYLSEARHFNTLKMGMAASVPLIAAVITNMAGGWISDRLARQWSDLRRGRVAVSVAGFAVAGTAIIPGVLANDAYLGLAFLTLALAGLELTVGVSWALCLDIAGDFSGSVTGVMNTLGNLGGMISSVATAYLATKFGWNAAFVVASLFCLGAAVMTRRIDPNRSAVEELKAESTKA